MVSQNSFLVIPILHLIASSPPGFTNVIEVLSLWTLRKYCIWPFKETDIDGVGSGPSGERMCLLRDSS